MKKCKHFTEAQNQKNTLRTGNTKVFKDLKTQY